MQYEIKVILDKNVPWYVLVDKRTREIKSKSLDASRLKELALKLNGMENTAELYNREIEQFESIQNMV